jgi:hypothetical protein
MNRHSERICGYRIRYVERSIIVDERARYVILEVPRVIFGLAFMFPFFLLAGAFLLENGVLGVRRPDPHSYSQYPAWQWLIIVPFLFIPVLFAVLGFFVAFARVRVEAVPGRIRRGYTWFGVPIRLNAVTISETAAIKLQLEARRSGLFGSRDYYVTCFDDKESRVELFSCTEKEGALKLANEIAEIAGLAVHDAAES